MPLLLALLGCAPPPEPAAPALDCQAGGPDAAWIVTDLRFARQFKRGVSWGFDLDGGDEDVGCDVADFVSPSGEVDVDNAFAMALPALERTEAAAVEDIIRETLVTGSLLLVFELHDLDDLQEDACVDLTLGRGAGEVSLSAEGEILPNQTFDRDPGLPFARTPGASLSGGALRAEGMRFELPFTFLNASLTFVLNDTTLMVELDEEGQARGVMGGSVDVADLVAVAGEQGIDPAVLSTLEGLLALITDIDVDGDGDCESASITFTFEAAPAFFYPDSPGWTD